MTKPESKTALKWMDAASALTKNEAVLRWMEEMAAMTQPDKIVWITGEEEQLEALRRTGRGRFRVPDSWGIGWVFEPRTNWLLSTELKHVSSSKLAPRANGGNQRHAPG